MKFLLRLFLLLVVAGGGLVGWLALTPFAEFNGEAYVKLPRGTGTLAMATALAESGVVSSRWAFLAARAMRPRARLQAGEYSFDHPASAREIFDRIVLGDVTYLELAVPEGKNMFDVAGIAAGMQLFPASAFLAAARNPSSIQDLDPDAPSLEGYLFPDTYRLPRHVTAEKVCQIMTGKFRETWKRLGGEQSSAHQVVTLASLVEKESKLAEERGQIASVFARRLKIGMKLDCDPTVIYAALLRGKYRGTIYRSDLDNEHPYNTYRHAGLPPGPIANPGEAALKAALHPAETEYLFFVKKPDNSGGHYFSATIGEHDKAAARYRKGR